MEQGVTAEDRQTAGSRWRPTRQSVGRGLVGLPDRAVLLVFWSSIAVTIAVLFKAFDPWIVVPTWVAIVAATWRLMPAPPPPGRQWVASSLAAVAGTVAWVAINLPHASTYVVVARDPGFLTLEGLWLMRNSDPVVPVGTALDVAAVVEGASARGAGFGLAGDVLNAQGAKLLPALLAGLGWVGGDHAVLGGNLVLGAAGLLAVYALARRIVGPVWALLPALALGASMPMVAFSRAAYTEPVVVAFILGGLTMAWSAYQTNSWWRFAIAAGMVGAGSLARIDGAISVIGLLAGMALVAAAPVAPVLRRRLLTAFLVALPASLVMVLLGYLDLRVHSPGYLNALGGEYQMLTLGLLATVLIGVAIAVPRWWNPIRGAAIRHRRALGWAGVALAGLVAVVLISRPLWLAPHLVPEGSPYANLVGAVQEAEGLPIDPTRSYDEQTVVWLSWYFGWPAVILAFVGFGLMAWRALRRRDPRYLLILSTIAAPSALFLWRVSITPDQIWAMRRLLAPTVPGFLIAATVVLAALWGVRRRAVRALTLALAISVGIFPFFTWGQLFGVAEQDGRYGELKAICAAIPGDRVVSVRHGATPYLSSLRTVCDVEVVQVDEPTPDKLRAVREAWGGTDLPVVLFSVDGLDHAEFTRPLRATSTSTWPHTLTKRPAEPRIMNSNAFVGLITEEGGIVPLPEE